MMMEGLDPTTIAAVCTGLGTLVGALGKWLIDRRKTEHEIQTEERKQIANRQTRLSERLEQDAEKYRLLYLDADRRHDELLERSSQEKAELREHIARLEERLDRKLADMDDKLSEISTATGDWRAKTPQNVTAESRET